MDTSLIIILAAAVVVLFAAALLWQRFMGRGNRLHRHFGPEYDRTVGTYDGDERAAQQDLSRRLKEHRGIDLHDVPPETREQYEAEWVAVQEEFVDSPGAAVADADRLLARAARDRGFPSAGYDQQVAALSVHYPRQVSAYREVHDVAVRTDGRRAEVDELRRALLHARDFLDTLTVPMTEESGRPDAEGDRRGSAVRGMPRAAHTAKPTHSGDTHHDEGRETRHE